MQSATPDKRFKGINELAAHKVGQHPPYTTDYSQIAKTDPDYLVRATAIRALNRARLKEATPLFITALADDNAKVRLEGAKALVNLPDDNAVAPLVALLNKPDEDKDVRIAAATALKHYKRLDVARALAANLSEREFGVAWQSRRSLRSLTGKDFAFSEPAWLDYFVGPTKPFG
jgi:HEAT repeat protein